jgi:excisionase family DNA binding protein
MPSPAAPTAPDVLLTRVEAARYLRVSVRTFDRLSLSRARVGRLVRVRQSELDAYLLERTVRPPPSPRLDRPAGTIRLRKPVDTAWLQTRLADLKRRRTE